MLRRFLQQHPRLKRCARAVRDLFGSQIVSGNYMALDSTAVSSAGRELQRAWQDISIPQRQRAIVDAELKAYRTGAEVVVFDVLVAGLQRLPLQKGFTLLEIGCSSGYYSEVLALRGLQTRYRGCDYSPAFIELAHDCYPQIPFDVMDATHLGYENGQFEVVVSGCCLLHILDYSAAIAEAARVAENYVIFHRTPVLHQGTTRHYTKEAYGVKTIEVHFNEQELVRLFAAHNLLVIDIATLSAEWRDGDAFAIKTYICRKISSV